MKCCSFVMVDANAITTCEICDELSLHVLVNLLLLLFIFTHIFDTGTT